MVDLNIINGRVFLPGIGIKPVGLSLQQGKIAAIGDKAALPAAAETIDAEGLLVMPGAIDPHVHLGFCQDFAADCRAETRAALVGGVTTIGCFLGGTTPHSQTFPERKHTFDTHAYTDVFPHLCINTKEQVQEIPRYVREWGLNSFKFFMFCIPGYMPSQTNSFILHGFREIARSGPDCLCSVHAEDASLMQDGWNEFFQAGKQSLSDWAESNPDEAEELAVIVAAALAEMSGVRLNLVHLATARALKRLKLLRQANPLLHGETLVLYLALNAASQVEPTAARWSPALRSSEDQESLWEGVREGTIGTIGTDQDCVTRAGLEKFIQDYGVSGSSNTDALFLPLLLTEGFHKRHIPLEILLETVTANPARLWGLYPRKGAIAVGSDADVVLLDLEREFVVDWAALPSACDWSLYQGWKLQGRPVLTVKAGKIVMREGEVSEDQRTGRCLKKVPA